MPNKKSPKQPAQQPNGYMNRIVAALIRVRQLHSPCVSPECPIDFQHCTGCNEAFPCKTIHALEGTDPFKRVQKVEIEVNNPDAPDSIAVIEEGNTNADQG